MLTFQEFRYQLQLDTSVKDSRQFQCPPSHDTEQPISIAMELFGQVLTESFSCLILTVVQAFCGVIKMLGGISASNISVLGFQSQVYSWFQFPAKAGRQQVMDQIAGSL